MSAIVRIVPSSAGRVPPHDLDAEAAVLSASLLSATALGRAVAILTPEHFYSEAHRRVFESAVALCETSTPVDVVTAAGWLKDRDRLAQVGGMPYLHEILGAAPALGPAQVEAYARIVFDKWRLRTLIETCQRVAAEGYADVGDLESFFDDAGARVHEATSARGKAKTVQTMRAAARDAFARIKAQAESHGAILGTRTGFERLDRALGGMHAGDLLVFAGRPAMGKTSLVMNIALNVALQKQGAAGTARKEIERECQLTASRVRKDQKKKCSCQNSGSKGDTVSKLRRRAEHFFGSRFRLVRHHGFTYPRLEKAKMPMDFSWVGSVCPDGGAPLLLASSEAIAAWRGKTATRGYKMKLRGRAARDLPAALSPYVKGVPVGSEASALAAGRELSERLLGAKLGLTAWPAIDRRKLLASGLSKAAIDRFARISSEGERGRDPAEVDSVGFEKSFYRGAHPPILTLSFEPSGGADFDRGVAAVKGKTASALALGASTGLLWDIEGPGLIEVAVSAEETNVVFARLEGDDDDEHVDSIRSWVTSTTKERATKIEIAIEGRLIALWSPIDGQTLRPSKSAKVAIPLRTPGFLNSALSVRVKPGTYEVREGRQRGKGRWLRLVRR